MWREKKKDRNRFLDRKLGLLVNRYAKKPANSHWGDSARFFLLSLGFLVPAPERAFLAEPAVAWPPAVHHAAVPALLLAGSLARPSNLTTTAYIDGYTQKIWDQYKISISVNR